MQDTDSKIYVKKYTKTPENPLVFPVREREVWRYCGYFGIVDDNETALREVYEEAKRDMAAVLSYGLCYRTISSGEICKGGSLEFLMQSAQVMKLLEGCSHVVLFAATAGIGIDQAINRMQKISPTKALVMQGFGAERIEALCDAFCDEYEAGLADNKDVTEQSDSQKMEKCLFVTPRFSPGYGDLPIDTQADFFSILDISHLLGISLGEGYFMKPSKSVTALFGVKEASKSSICELGEGSIENIDEKDALKSGSKCQKCDKVDCEYREK
ncbi:MAG: hypothetical protein MJ107_03885 [Lachnospiraceae bacterium]|nr:hypothetical protein [Lachnospiraceae bacterium]